MAWTPTWKASCSGQLRLSSLTLPHPMVRVVLAEQLYRAWAIMTNHPTTAPDRRPGSAPFFTRSRMSHTADTDASPARLYLASASPRRRELLTQIGLAHKVLLVPAPRAKTNPNTKVKAPPTTSSAPPVTRRCAAATGCTTTHCPNCRYWPPTPLSF